MAVVEMKIVGAKDLARKLNFSAESMYDFGDALEEAGQYWRDQVAKQFQFHGFVAGRARLWKRLSPYTIEKKRGDTRPLIHYGGLEASYVDVGAPGNISEVSTTSARFGSGYKTKNNAGKLKPVAMFHQIGTRDMAARPVAFGNRFYDRQILDSFTDHIFRVW